MSDAAIAARWQFAFTIMFHYLFPILTMGLGVLIAVFKTIELRSGNPQYGSAGVGQFMLDLHGVTRDPRYLAFAEKMTTDLLARATRDVRGTRWVQAEHRVKPDLLVAQTGYMQGAAGIGMWLLRLDGQRSGRAPFVRFPDSPW